MAIEIILRKVRWIIFFTLIACLLYYPYLTGSNVGGPDARFYFNLLADSITQFKIGIFPIYLTQSIFDITGTSQMSAPLYYLAGIFLDLITFNRLNYIYIQHLIIIFGAIFSAIFMFYSLIKINPELKIEAALISILYITSPGLASLMFYMDSYYAFLAVTFIPLVLISLFLINKVNSYKSYLLFSIFNIQFELLI